MCNNLLSIVYSYLVGIMQINVYLTSFKIWFCRKWSHDFHLTSSNRTSTDHEFRNSNLSTLSHIILWWVYSTCIDNLLWKCLSSLTTTFQFPITVPPWKIRQSLFTFALNNVNSIENLIVYREDVCRIVVIQLSDNTYKGISRSKVYAKDVAFFVVSREFADSCRFEHLL